VPSRFVETPVARFHYVHAGKGSPMTTAIGSFMDAVGVRRAALAGNSWSGGWALAFAQRHTERVSRLALLDPTALGGRDAWSSEILKYPVVGELLTNLLGTRKSTVRSALEQTLVHRDRLTDELVDEARAPLTFHDNLEATYRLERGLDWCGHAVMLDCPGQVNALLAVFLGQRQ
jgi:pimeloyl-ACP methyl ester carboxylesterase